VRQQTLPSLAPDLILTNASVVTVDAQDRVVESLAVTGDRIAMTGSSADVLRTRGPQTTVVDLEGRTVIPGLIDGHAHMDREGLRVIYPSLAGARSIGEIQDRIRTLAAETPPGEWIVTMPIGEPPYYFSAAQGLAEGRFPNRWELDEAAPEHPVYIRGIWGYWDRPPITSIANSRALELVGVSRDTHAPSSTVEIEHDPGTGEPTGIFREHAAIPVLEFTLFRAIPRFTHQDRVRGLRTAMAQYLATGTTSVYEAHGVAPEVQVAYRELYESGALTVRSHIVLSPTWASTEEAERTMADWLPYASGRGTGDEWLRFGGIFVGFGERGDVARILHDGLPYTGWAGFCEWEHPPDEFEAMVRAAARHGLRVNTMTNNESTLAAVLERLEAVSADVPITHLRFVLEHIRGATMETIERMRRLGVIVTTQPAGYLWKGGAALLDAGMDGDRLLPHVDFDRAGLPYALSTDNKPASAFWALWAAVERIERLAGRSVGSSQRITPLRALRALTADAARLTFEEDVKGSIEPGKYADLVVLGDDLLAMPVRGIRDLTAELTIVGGRLVHCSNEALRW
jgi:predicted amidohydrolase YtcJ